MDFKNSKTRINLMRAFAGESQARNRYTFAAEKAKQDGYPVLEAVFLFTANQEKEHAEIFYKHLKDFAGEEIPADGNYPIDIYSSVEELLRSAQKNEYGEFDTVYKEFGDIANDEGFAVIGRTFHNIAGIEKVHGDRFGYFANLMEQNMLYVSDAEDGWMCTNCGYVFSSDKAPGKCPVCEHSQGYFIRLTMAPYTASITRNYPN